MWPRALQTDKNIMEVSTEPAFDGMEAMRGDRS